MVTTQHTAPETAMPPGLVTGPRGERMIDAALGALLIGWGGSAEEVGCTQPRSYWREDMRRALTAALRELMEGEGSL